MTAVHDVRQASRIEAEIVLKIGDQASILLDIDERNDGPPCLCIQGDCVQLLLYPHGWYEYGQVTKADLDRLSDLVIDVTRMRDAVLRRLRQQNSADVDGPGHVPADL